ncbi:hypothetical protein BD779DRAFT_1550629 [Infundibulicybe gibba]|nr:hypothetical protein BD779DRAFT_1550629 [Infundibulicybe gibba]
MSFSAPYNSNSRQQYQQNSPSRRPASIAELAERALESLWDDNRDLKYYLRLAEKYRRDGKELLREGDLETATLVLERIPSHRDYHTVLNTSQRHNLGLNGQDILDNLGDLKPTLVERYERWLAQHPNGVEDQRTPEARPPRGQAIHEEASRQQQQAEENARRAREEQERQERTVADELARWREQREANARQEERERAASGASAYVYDRRREAAVAAAHRAANPPLTTTMADTRHEMQQEEMRKREEDIRSQKREQKRRQEQDGIVQRQREADLPLLRCSSLSAASSAASIGSYGSASSIYHPPSSSLATTPASSFYQTTPPSNIYSAVSASLRTPSAADLRPPQSIPQYSMEREVEPALMPLESPTRYEGDSTDSESVHDSDWRRTMKSKNHIADHHKTPTRAPARSPSYPPPITTTSPPPFEGGGRVLYPQLMSQHQKTQGYFPSLNSMFIPTANNAQPPPAGNHSLYPPNMLPPPSVPPSSYPGMSTSSNLHISTLWTTISTTASATIPPVPGPSRPPPPVPAPPPPPAPSNPPAHNRSESERITRTANPTDPSPILKTVNLPRECLPRFLAIARDKGHKYVVTTLLIPKQHSTSDTCTMDEEELVLQFTEERSLITLGFMSSVDLHTHSGFQRMLPESFAVVCAPKSNPNFGIFRLTDPPGLKTVLECTAKEAFHPHPDVPIYTDADKGHVQMKDAALEIVDLR